MRLIRCLALFLTLSLAIMIAGAITPVHAQTVTIQPVMAQAPPQHISTRELYRLCTSASDVDYGMCAGYVTALADLLMSESVAAYKACAFSAVRPQEIMDIVKNFIGKNPDMNDRPAHITAAAALAGAFPCP